MEPFDTILDEIATFYSGEPGSARWENITACFGWTAAATLIVGFLATVTGYHRIGAYGVATFPFFLWRAFARDWKKIKHRKNNAKKNHTVVQES
jgi:hypothetical protein